MRDCILYRTKQCGMRLNLDALIHEGMAWVQSLVLSNVADGLTLACPR
jgi:hypothetical protein